MYVDKHMHKRCVQQFAWQCMYAVALFQDCSQRKVFFLLHLTYPLIPSSPPSLSHLSPIPLFHTSLLPHASPPYPLPHPSPLFLNYLLPHPSPSPPPPAPMPTATSSAPWPGWAEDVGSSSTRRPSLAGRERSEVSWRRPSSLP